jgi:hypothetical protein
MHSDPPPLFTRSNSHPHLQMGDSSRNWSHDSNRSAGSSGTGKLPKVQFPVFEGENPKLWLAGVKFTLTCMRLTLVTSTS